MSSGFYLIGSLILILSTAGAIGLWLPSRRSKLQCTLIHEITKLREMLQWCAEESWEKGEIDGGDFQEAMVKAGLFVEVPADEQFRADWDADEMFVTSWPPLAEGKDIDPIPFPPAEEFRESEIIPRRSAMEKKE